MANIGNASDTSDEYESSSVTIAKTSPCDPRQLKNALIRLQENFDLLDEQLDALPALGQMSLLEQNDSHRILTEDGYRDAHAFKLYVGEMKWDIDREKRRDPVFVYLFKSTKARKDAPFRMEISNGDIKEGHWPPIDVKYFGKLGFEAGLYSEDPCFKFSEGWQKQLRAACDDLIGVEQAKAVRALQKQNRARAITATPSSTVDKSSLPQIRRTHLAFAEQQNKTMAGDSGNDQQIKRKNGDHPDPMQHPQDMKPQYRPARADRNPCSPQPSYFGATQSVHEPPFHGYGAAPPNPGDHAASPFPPTPSPHYDNFPAKTTSSYTQYPGAHLHLRRNTKKSVQTKAKPESQRGTLAVSGFTTLEDEYASLYQKRHEIGVRMEEIKRSLTAERYTALMAKLNPR